MRTKVWLVGAMAALTLVLGETDALAKPANVGRRLSVSDLASDSIDLRMPVAEVIPTVARVAYGGDLKRGDFETSDAFQSRQDAAAGIAELMSGGALLLDANVNGASNVRAEYDPDAEQLSFFVHAGTKSLAVPQGFQTFTVLGLNSTGGGGGSYVGQNSFGAKAVISKHSWKVYGAAFVSQPEYLIDNAFGARQVAYVKLGAAQAKKELPRVKCVIAMEVTSGSLASSKERKPPTVSDPDDEVTEGRYLIGRFVGVVFYSGITGHVLGRYPDNFAMKPAASDAAAN